MKNILYPLVASAFVTITPFLLTFEKGQDITRGLVDYSIFIFLFFFIFVKENLKKNQVIVLTLLFLILFAIAYCDLKSLLTMKKANSWWYIFLPLLTCVGAVIMVYKIKALSICQILLIALISLFGHAFLLHIFPTQPLLQFPVISAVYSMTPNPDWPRNNLTHEFREKNNATDSVSVTRYYVDTSRSNVVVLVESWGIPMDSAMFAKELALLEGLIKDHGIHFRMYSRTRTAEREDLLDSAWRDSTGRRDSLFMPNRFASLGYKTSFLFGGDSTIQWRYKYIQNIGFQNAIWTDSATDDVTMAVKIDSLLSQPDSIKQFIAWTTHDTRFPISDDPFETEKLYNERLLGTLRAIADLARKHSDVRFIVQGDHEPILSPLEFQRKFYRRWIPFVVLN
jgi:hypothetical protein